MIHEDYEGHVASHHLFRECENLRRSLEIDEETMAAMLTDLAEW